MGSLPWWICEIHPADLWNIPSGLMISGIKTLLLTFSNVCCCFFISLSFSSISLHYIREKTLQLRRQTFSRTKRDFYFGLHRSVWSFCITVKKKKKDSSMPEQWHEMDADYFCRLSSLSYFCFSTLRAETLPPRRQGFSLNTHILQTEGKKWGRTALLTLYDLI